MIYKEDFEKVKERYEAFLEGEIIDRALISITAPRNKPLSDRKLVQYTSLL